MRKSSLFAVSEGCQSNTPCGRSSTSSFHLLLFVCDIASKCSCWTSASFHLSSASSSVSAVYVCLCLLWELSSTASVCVCQCAYKRAPCQVTGNTEQAGVDRYEPDWAASFSWKLQRRHYNSSSHWWTTWHEFASLALIGSAPASPCPQLAQPCGVWHERGEGGGGREEGCYRHSDSKLQVTCRSHVNSETTERMKEKHPLLQSCPVIRRHPASFIFLFLQALLCLEKRDMTHVKAEWVRV